MLEFLNNEKSVQGGSCESIKSCMAPFTAALSGVNGSIIWSELFPLSNTVNAMIYDITVNDKFVFAVSQPGNDGIILKYQR